MKNQEFGKYLYTRRIKSGATTVSEYLRNKSLNISEQFYRALENGDKLPAAENIGELANALNTDPYSLYQYYLEEILPPHVFQKLVNPVSAEVTIESPKEALDEKDETLKSYRASLRKMPADITEDVYRSDDIIVDFLKDHVQWLPLIHYIYMKESAASEDELRRICIANHIKDHLDTILTKFQEYRIVNVSETIRGKKKQLIATRFNRAFRLPSTPKGRALRAKWIQFEIAKALDHEQRCKKADLVRPDKTFSFAMIDCYNLEKLAKVNDRITDLIAELHSAGSQIDDAQSQPFFVYLTASPRLEYGQPPASKHYQPTTK